MKNNFNNKESKLSVEHNEDQLRTLKCAIEAYHESCNILLKLFCDRHEMEYDENAWAGEEPGGIAMIGDYYIDMQTIYYDIRHLPPVEEFVKWYDYGLRVGEFETHPINYSSWCMGAPRMTEEAINKLTKMKQELEQIINDYGQG